LILSITARTLVQPSSDGTCLSPVGEAIVFLVGSGSSRFSRLFAFTRQFVEQNRCFSELGSNSILQNSHTFILYDLRASYDLYDTNQIIYDLFTAKKIIKNFPTKNQKIK
jgi:hypothetical protein